MKKLNYYQVHKNKKPKKKVTNKKTLEDRLFLVEFYVYKLEQVLHNFKLTIDEILDFQSVFTNSLNNFNKKD